MCLEACWRPGKRVSTGSPDIRGIAQPGSAAVLGTAGRWFESSCPDQSVRRCPIPLWRPFKTLDDWLRCAATSARVFRGMAWLRATNSDRLPRTFRRQHRHIGIGDFSAQYLNGRRQAMILRLRGVAFWAASVRAAPAVGERHERPHHPVVIRCLDCRLGRRIVGGQLDDRERRRAGERGVQAI